MIESTHHLDEIVRLIIARNDYVYFMLSPDNSRIRIGHTHGDPQIRTSDHAKYNYRLLAIIPGNKKFETELHRHFEHYNAPTDKTDTSHYERNAVQPYVDRLLEWHLAADNYKKVPLLGRPDLHQLHPNYKPPMNGTFFPTQSQKALESDTWQTPNKIVKIVREALGGVIELDPCTCLEANERIKAEHFFTEYSDGLKHTWRAKTVFMNPPYHGEYSGLAKAFCLKLGEEYSKGHVEQAIAILNSEGMSTDWFEESVAAYATSFAFSKKRIAFIGKSAKSGKVSNAPRNGTVFIYYGDNYRHFRKTFDPYSYVGNFH